MCEMKSVRLKIEMRCDHTRFINNIKVFIKIWCEIIRLLLQ